VKRDSLLRANPPYFFALRLAIVICATLLPLRAAIASGASVERITLEQYIAELDRCSDALSGAANDAAALRQLRMSLPERWDVEVENQTYDVSSEWLSADLAKIETARHGDTTAKKDAKEEIAVHRDAAQALAQSLAPRNLNDTSAKLKRILSAKEFQAIQGPSAWDLWRARAWDWTIRHLEKIFGGIGHGKVIGNVIAWTVIVLTALLLLLWAVRATMRTGSRAQMDLRGASAAGKDSSYWLRESREAAGRGDYRLAIHAAYWAAIARLEEIKALTEDRSRTPRESLRLIRRESGDYQPLAQLTRRFELVWYGYRSANSSDLSDAMQQLEKLGCLRSSTPAISAS